MLTTEYLTTILVDTNARERRAAAASYRRSRLAQRWRPRRGNSADCATP